MRITLEQLKTKRACIAGIKYFLSRDWKSDAEILEDLSHLNHDWMLWVAIEFQLPLPAGLTTLDCCRLSNYDQPLPAGLATLECSNLSYYECPLPAGLTTLVCDGLYNYAHQLPAGLTSLECIFGLSNYKHPLPVGVKIL